MVGACRGAARRPAANVAAIMTLADATPAQRARAVHAAARARAVVLHRRDHGDCGARPGRQPRRRRPLRRADRHVLAASRFPACGFSLGLERILVVMGERGMFPPDVQASGPDVLVTIFDDALTSESLRLASELRAGEPARRGISRSAAAGRIWQGVQVRRSRGRRVSWPSSGRDEARRAATVKIKNMATGEQQSRPVAAAVCGSSTLQIAPRTSRPRDNRWTCNPSERSRARIPAAN